MPNQYLSGIFEFAGPAPRQLEEVDFIHPELEADPEYTRVEAFVDTEEEPYTIGAVKNYGDAGMLVDGFRRWHASRNGHESAGLNFTGKVRIVEPDTLSRISWQA